MTKASERASKGGFRVTKNLIQSHSVDPVTITGDGATLMNTAHPVGDYADGALYVYDGESQTFIPHASINDSALVTEEIEIDEARQIPQRTLAESLIIMNQIMIMKSHVAIMERMAGDINMAEALKKQIRAAEEF